MIQKLVAVAVIVLALVFAGAPVFADAFDDAFNKDISKGIIDKSTKTSLSQRAVGMNGKTLREQRKLEYEMQNQQADFQLYLQMQKVDNWLSQWCTWNHRFPSYVLEQNKAIVQLNELVPNNPYSPGQLQEAKGRSTDPNYRYINQPLNQFYHGEAADGFAPNSFVPNSSYGYEAYGYDKIRLVYNPSLTAEEVREWEYNPPDSWKAPPGAITGISNSRNLIVVWGAGADGRPIKVPGQPKRIRIFVSNILMGGSVDDY